MSSFICYLHAHHGYVLRRCSYRDVGGNTSFIDEEQSRRSTREMAERVYVPANRRLRECLRAGQGRVRVALSLSGVLVEQLAAWAPEALESFGSLLETGWVELVGATYYQSVAAQVAPHEFRHQVHAHALCMERIFGERPATFYHVGDLYDDVVGDQVAKVGFEGVIGVIPHEVLGWRSPHTVYQVPQRSLRLLPCSPVVARLLADSVRYLGTSEDGERGVGSGDRVGAPRDTMSPSLPADQLGKLLAELCDSAEVVGLPFSYENRAIFGEEMEVFFGLADRLAMDPEGRLLLPRECLEHHRSPDTIVVPRCTEGAALHVQSLVNYNRMQQAVVRELFSLIPQFRRVVSVGEKSVEKIVGLVELWRKLQSVEYVLAMSTNGDKSEAGRSFVDIDSPYEAFISYMNMVRGIQSELTTMMLELRHRDPGL